LAYYDFVLNIVLVGDPAETDLDAAQAMLEAHPYFCHLQPHPLAGDAAPPDVA
jgi:hypothetical protein